jgi:hypothetical protein
MRCTSVVRSLYSGIFSASLLITLLLLLLLLLFVVVVVVVVVNVKQSLDGP